MFASIFHFHETYQAKIDENSDFHNVYVYKVVDGIFDDPASAINVALGMSHNSIVKELDSRTQLVLASTLVSEIENIHKNNKRCLIVFIVTEFPYIQMKIDTRDQ